MNNPLLKTFKTEFESTPFSKIKIEHFIPALKKTIKSAINEVNLISSQNELPSFSNTIEPSLSLSANVIVGADV